MEEKQIVLISEDEQFTYRFGESEIYYRRISPAKARMLREMHTKNGRLDNEAFTQDGIRYAITGWKNIKDIHGKDVPFSPDKLDFLPSRVQAELSFRVTGGVQYDELVDLEKN